MRTRSAGIGRWFVAAFADRAGDDRRALLAENEQLDGTEIAKRRQLDAGGVNRVTIVRRDTLNRAQPGVDHAGRQVVGAGKFELLDAAEAGARAFDKFELRERTCCASGWRSAAGRMMCAVR